MESSQTGDIVLYDGVCGLCNGLVQFLLTRDREARLRFAPLQSPFARKMLGSYGLPVDDFDTIYVIVSDGRGGRRLLTRSRAMLHILRQIGGPWRASAILAPLPTSWLDFAYGIVARNRYRLFGKSQTCMIPGPGWRDRFIEP